MVRIVLGVCWISNLISKPHRFAGGEGAQWRSGWRIFGTRPKGRTPRTGRSVAHTWHRLYKRRRLKRRVSRGGRPGTNTTTHRERESWTDRNDSRITKRIRQAGDGEVKTASVTRRATPARGKALGRHAGAASQPGERPTHWGGILESWIR